MSQDCAKKIALLCTGAVSIFSPNVEQSRTWAGIYFSQRIAATCNAIVVQCTSTAQLSSQSLRCSIMHEQSLFCLLTCTPTAIFNFVPNISVPNKQNWSCLWIPVNECPFCFLAASSCHSMHKNLYIFTDRFLKYKRTKTKIFDIRYSPCINFLLVQSFPYLPL